ncbi:MAG: hypothetical protein Ct9H300mP15_24610 [Gemmatimonadota bacterium]|nr:MAG: hypothetical protein Ct9H300mP15_24610 [Gemmatimonadota bacterium]
MIEEYAERRAWLMPALKEAGFSTVILGGPFTSNQHLLSGLHPPCFANASPRNRSNALPGTMFGDTSTDYIRISYLQPLPLIQEAMERIASFTRSMT